jgi:predicted nucleic acid-binding protein
LTALEHALKESNLLSADLLMAACTLLSNLKQTNAAAILSAAVNSGNKDSQPLADAIEQAKRDGVKAYKIAEAEGKLQKLRRDEELRAEIDLALAPAIDMKCLESLELHLQRATAHSVTSKTIEAARALVGQLRSMGDSKRIMLLLSDALRLRSVSVLEHVIKSADDAG